MTKDQPSPVEAFITKVAKAHPRLRLTCDGPEHAAGSTYIDIRAGDDLVVVEHRPDRGFGFAGDTPDSDVFGTPSAIFFNDVDRAFAHLEQVLDRSLAIGADEAGRHGA